MSHPSRLVVAALLAATAFTTPVIAATAHPSTLAESTRPNQDDSSMMRDEDSMMGMMGMMGMMSQMGEMMEQCQKAMEGAQPGSQGHSPHRDNPTRVDPRN
jgi:hypothetical protein